MHVDPGISKEKIDGVALTFKQLAMLLGLPEDVRIVRVWVDDKIADDVVYVHVTGPGIGGSCGLQPVCYTMQELVPAAYKVRIPRE